MKADTNDNLLEKSPKLSYFGDGYPYTPPEKCSLLLDEFADYASNFTRCSIKHARPIRLCEECIDHYVNFSAKYEELLTTVVNGTSCKSSFISQDRLDAVLDYHDNILYIWDKGNCNACFDWNMTTPKVSNATRDFNKLLNLTMGCIHKNNQTANNTETVCENCMNLYVQLDEYYKSLSSDSIGVDSICMDIVDSMNTTRSIWSKGYGCCKLRQSPEIIFLVCSAIISALPFLYYLALRYCGPMRELANVLKR
ncbi:Osteopetrosis-associated transmembrane protein 1, partial [Operophtera brumata]